MEELLKEILAELKKLNSGIIMSADDMLALLERNKESANQRSRSIFSTVLSENNEDKPEVDLDKLHGYFKDSGGFVRIGDIIICADEIRHIKISDKDKARIVITLKDNTYLCATASDFYKMSKAESIAASLGLG